MWWLFKRDSHKAKFRTGSSSVLQGSIIPRLWIQYTEVVNMSSNYSRIKVSDLLNDAPARGKTSHRPKPPSEDIYTVQCDVQRCGRRFATTEALRAHRRRSHPAPSAHACNECGATLSSSANLNKHVSSSTLALFLITGFNLWKLTRFLSRFGVFIKKWNHLSVPLVTLHSVSRTVFTGICEWFTSKHVHTCVYTALSNSRRRLIWKITHCQFMQSNTEVIRHTMAKTRNKICEMYIIYTQNILRWHRRNFLIMNIFHIIKTVRVKKRNQYIKPFSISAAW